jgi:hypothetical protein
MVAIKKLLTKGYFPKELPPQFSTASFAALVTDTSQRLPSELTNSRKVAKTCAHSLSRTGLSRRRLSIPNPVPHLSLCTQISNNWQDIRQRIWKSPFSITKPVNRGAYDRALAPQTDLGSVIEDRAHARRRAGYVLRADISEFYPSIYTHSIPWAIHSKATSKVDRTDLLYGNVIDRCTRNSQDGQTVGVPIGPDTSLAISELVLSAVDQKLHANARPLSGIRFYDDYELTFSRSSDAENALAVLQQVLDEFELNLNPRKTFIERLPKPLDLRWVSTIRTFDVGLPIKPQRSGLIGFFDLLFRLTDEYPHDNVVAYAISRLENEPIHSSNAELCQDLLSQAVTAQPA